MSPWEEDVASRRPRGAYGEVLMALWGPSFGGTRANVVQRMSSYVWPTISCGVGGIVVCMYLGAIGR